MICSKCGYENLDKNKFCENCGEALTKQEVLYKKLQSMKDLKDLKIKNNKINVEKSTNLLLKQPEEVKLSYYGAMFSIAGYDGNIEKEEFLKIYEILDIENLSPYGKQQIFEFSIQPPHLNDLVNYLKDTPEEIRYSFLINLVEIAKSDDYFTEKKDLLLQNVAITLNISEKQYKAILNFVDESIRIKKRGLDDNLAQDSLKKAASMLTGVGVPLTAVYFSGSVIGLSAAGITSGLAALGLGFGMFTGIGTAIALGTVCAIGVNKVLNISKKRKKGKIAKERERRAQLVVKNLQETINVLIEKIEKLQDCAADAEANKEAINLITKRLITLQKAVNARTEMTTC